MLSEPGVEFGGDVDYQDPVRESLLESVIVLTFQQVHPTLVEEWTVS